MLLTSDVIKANMEKYSNKNSKICRDEKEGKLVRIRNGLYETDKTVNGYLLAGSIYGPSYLSFDYALHYYGLIPEKVTTYTSATCEKKKKRIYNNFFGTYTYRDVPVKAYPLGVRLLNEGEYSFQIATPEKALCDKIYTLPLLKNVKQLEEVLCNDLRIDINDISKLNTNDIEEISNNYHSTNVNLLYRYMRRNCNE